jgi:hypothetical protein
MQAKFKVNVKAHWNKEGKMEIFQTTGENNVENMDDGENEEEDVDNDNEQGN